MNHPGDVTPEESLRLLWFGGNLIVGRAFVFGRPGAAYAAATKKVVGI
jgi:hypothetical protein